MNLINCRKCDHEYDGDIICCPKCETPTNHNIPNYPRFKGPGIIMFFWIFFVILMIVMMVSYLAM
jgi:hypothetical protein